MKIILVVLSILFATHAMASTCEDKVAASQVYSENLEIMLTVYEDAGWLQKAMIRHRWNLEIEAICDVKENRGRVSEYWTIPGEIHDEEFFKFVIEFYGL